MRIVCIIILLIAQAIGLLAYQDTSLKKSISERNISFINYPDFPEAHSTWGSIGYNPANNNVYIGVTNHADKVGFYEYDPASYQMKLNGFLKDLGHLRPFQWQGKMHSKIVAGPQTPVVLKQR